MGIRANFGETMKNELSGTEVKASPIQMGQMYAEYVIDITELEFEDKHNKRSVPIGYPEEFELQNIKYHAFQYRAMKTVLATGGMGAVWFKYEISPVEVHYNMYYESWSDFLVRLCSIVGGTFAAVGVLESLLRNGLCLVAPAPQVKA